MTKAKRILLAEDEVALRDFVSRNLRARGFDVLEASNGLEAMALWERENPDLLILDIMMPRMDGLEVCKRVREHSGVPIIVLTALDAESDKVTALDLGADDYLTKPFGVEELLARVRAVLRRTQWEVMPPTGGVKQFGNLEIDLTGHVVRLSGAAVRPSTCACISTVCARSWSPTLPTRSTYSQSRALGIALRRWIVREHADALLQHITAAAQVFKQTRYDTARDIVIGNR